MQWSPKRRKRKRPDPERWYQVLLRPKTAQVLVTLSKDSGRTPEDLVHLAVMLFESASRTLNIMHLPKPEPTKPAVKLAKGEEWKSQLQRLADGKPTYLNAGTRGPANPIALASGQTQRR